MQILVVDDEAPIRDLLSAFLESSGHTVRVAANGQDALRCLAASDSAFELIIADIKMPVMDGWELLRIVRERKLGVPVVLVSGQINVSAEDAARASAYRFLQKPFRLDELVGIVREIEAGRSATR